MHNTSIRPNRQDGVSAFNSGSGLVAKGAISDHFVPFVSPKGASCFILLLFYHEGHEEREEDTIFNRRERRKQRRYFNMPLSSLDYERPTDGFHRPPFLCFLRFSVRQDTCLSCGMKGVHYAMIRLACSRPGVVAG